MPSSLDPLLKLALAIHDNPGVYALLLGSGVSRSAGVPTGWEVVVDLVRRVAAAYGEQPNDPEAWYRSKFSREPNYGAILRQVASTPTERRAVLASYFEPTDDEREQGLKTPTKAHRAIAALAKAGNIRMILTTNFDRLMEEALSAEGVSHDVVYSVDALKGATPYVHGGCIVVKLHGDYRDTRIRNTPKELSRFPKELDLLLDRIFDEFGLIVCGWSAAFDTALKDAIAGCQSRHYTTFWLIRGDPTPEARELIQLRRAEQIPITGADEAFSKIHEAILSLDQTGQPHPVSVELAVATVKRYLSDARHRIALHDLLSEETERVHQAVSTQPVARGNTLTQEGFVARMQRYEAASKALCSMLAAIAYHDNGDNAYILTRTLSRLVSSARGTGMAEILRHYPALLALYAVGIASLAARRYRSLSAVLREPKFRDPYDYLEKSALTQLNVWSVFENRTHEWIPRSQRENTPANNRMLELLQPILADYIPDEQEREDTFDLFEYILALTYADIVKDSWMPSGRYWWRWRHRERPPSVEFLERGLEQGKDWPLLRAGFFSGSAERLNEVVAAHDAFVQQANHWW